jgi:hypothetical protein
MVVAAAVAFAFTAPDLRHETHAPALPLGWAVVVRIAGLGAINAALAAASVSAVASHVGRPALGLSLTVGLTAPRLAGQAPIISGLRTLVCCRISGELAQRIACDAEAHHEAGVGPTDVADQLRAVIKTSSWLGSDVQDERLGEIDAVFVARPASASNQLRELVRLAYQWDVRPFVTASSHRGTNHDDGLVTRRRA